MFRQDEPRFGMIAGWPTVEQGFHAARRALDPIARGNGGCRDVSPEEAGTAQRALEALTGTPLEGC